VRDFRSELASDKCWDRITQERFESGAVLDDCILQNREELVALCEFIEAQRIRSYLEIGLWTGRLLCALQRIFRFERVAACDHGWAKENGLRIHLPPEADFYHGDSESQGFLRWREALGPIDLVLLDANHAYHAVRRDFEINRRFPHRFLALHDITGAQRQTTGVGRLWRELPEREKTEIIRPHTEIGLDRSVMGIGIWAESSS